jgi:glycosyltransferase involved in cell wall biosynthesis
MYKKNIKNLNQNIFISVVIPIYKCADCIYELNSRLLKVLESVTLKFEIIFIDDASPDDAWNKITRLSKKNKKVKGIQFSRNFGQHCAITAGLKESKGKWVIVMDGDLQDAPEEIYKFINYLDRGYDSIVARRVNRKDNFLRRFFAKIFNLLMINISGVNLDYSIANFGIYSRKLIGELILLKEKSRSFGHLVHYVGFKRVEIEIEHNIRNIGKSSYSIRKLILHAIDIFTSYSNRVLYLILFFGIFLFCISSFYIVFIIFKHFFGLRPIAGWISLMSLISFIGGLIIMMLGTIGLYIGKIFDEVKDRPLYIVSAKTFN